MGDVAGHGIPAAMLMAMAKASVLLTDEEKSDPAMMLSSLHKVIYRVKSSKIKRMMTCQYFCIDAESGACRVANAGHCFPAVIRKRGEEVELIKLIGTPLGITKKPKYENTGMQLLNGDIVLLYTDGIIESQNTSGKEMGFDNFSRILASSYDDNLEVYYDNVFNAYKQWSAKADDDITMVLIRFAQTKEGTPT
jgi:sigma-B regulation protein RsbU (phosphoserine phosphatase)